MSARNKKMVIGFMTDFIKGNKKDCITYLTDDIKWNIVGMPQICGKQNFLEAMEMMHLWSSSQVCRTLTSAGTKNIIAEKEFVVVESTGENGSANCDIYKIYNGRIQEMTSYIVDTSVND